ncbi:MAG: BCCT family transporter, partial [Pseudomonadota bacterium]
DNRCDRGYRLGRDNVSAFGFDVHNPVFFLSAASLLPFIAVTLAFPETMSTALADAKTWVVSYFDGFFVITINLVTLFCIALALSPLGKIRLGGAAAKPEFGVLSWLAMLFSAGVGTGMVFWGTAEPAAYYTNWSGTPFNVDALTPEAERLAYSATIFHWGVAPWSIYAIVGLALAFFTFNKGLPLTIRSTFYPLIGDRVWGWLGRVIDLTAVIATVFGLATTLGFGATLAASGLHFIFDTPNTLTTRIAIIVLVTAIAICSVILGLERGVKRLSNLNIIIAAAFFAFAVIVGPTRDILANWVTSARDYVADTPRLSNWIGREDQTWFHDWTILYWAWWISWSPFVGMFIARVSKGRT